MRAFTFLFFLFPKSLDEFDGAESYMDSRQMKLAQQELVKKTLEKKKLQELQMLHHQQKLSQKLNLIKLNQQQQQQLLLQQQQQQLQQYEPPASKEYILSQLKAQKQKQKESQQQQMQQKQQHQLPLQSIQRHQHHSLSMEPPNEANTNASGVNIMQLLSLSKESNNISINNDAFTSAVGATSPNANGLNDSFESMSGSSYTTKRISNSNICIFYV